MPSATSTYDDPTARTRAAADGVCGDPDAAAKYDLVMVRPRCCG
jgi:hypothetical protein